MTFQNDFLEVITVWFLLNSKYVIQDDFKSSKSTECYICLILPGMKNKYKVEWLTYWNYEHWSQRIKVFNKIMFKGKITLKN